MGQPGPFGQQSTGAFGQQTSSPPPQQQQQQQQPFMQSQPTGFQQSNFAQPQPLQAQATGSNPFRQSMMPLNTNPTGFNPSGAFSQPTSPFHSQNPAITPSNGLSGNQANIQRPGSTPALSLDTSMNPLVAQKTGSNNPFAPPGGVQKPPPMPQQKGPSMNEMAWNKQQSQFAPQQTGAGMGMGMNGGGGSGPVSPSPWSNGTSLNGKPAAGSGISDIASSFTFDNNKSTTSGSGTDFLSQFGSISTGTGPGTPASTSQFGSISSNPTGQMSPSRTGSTGGGGGFLQPQATGMGGSTVKRFQPTSSFGSQLMETLPPIQEPGATSPAAQQPGQSAFNLGQGQSGQSGQGATGGLGGMGGLGGIGGMGQNTLSPQATGAPNPFRQSMFNSGGMGAQPTGQGSSQGGPQNQAPFAGAAQGGQGGFGNAFGGAGATFGSGASGQSSPFGATSPFAGQNRPQQGMGGIGGMSGFGGFGQQQQGGQGQAQGGSLI